MADKVTVKTIAVVATTFAFVNEFYPCNTGIEIDEAQQEIRAAGGEPVVFYREGHFRQPANNVAGTVTGSLVQAGDINGGVRLG